MTTAAWDERLRAQGYRITPQRQFVLEAVTRLGHGTPEEILAEVQRQAAGVNLSTVYRTLDVLEEMWGANRDEKFATFPMPCVRPKVVVGVNSIALAKVAGRRADGVNVRASHPNIREILRAGRPADDRTFMMTVWDFLGSEPSPSRPRAGFNDLGVNRIIKLVRGKVDPRDISMAKESAAT